MNKADGQRLAFYLEALGFKAEEDIFQADLIVFVTCGVKQPAEDRVYGLVNQIRRHNPSAIIALTGCLSDRPDLRSRVGKKIEMFFNISNLLIWEKDLKKFFPRIKSFPHQDLKSYLDLEAKRSSKFSALVPIGNGCNNFCSYCVVPYARGPEVYRPASDILSEVKKLLKEGYKEINLIAQNVNSYQSEGLNFAQLLKMIDDLEGNFWLRFATSHPKDVDSELIKVLKNGRHIVEHFHLAVQSGDNDILTAMNRKYKIEEYEKVVKKIRQALDNKNGFPASISTDIIVGFPGETKKNFQNTVKLLERVKFDLIYISKYSPRFGTVSAGMKDNVSLEEKKRREQILTAILKKTALENNQVYLEREVEILVEGRNRRGEFFGRTRTFKMVTFKSDENANDLIGLIVKVRIKKVLEFELKGELVSPKPKLVVLLGPTASGKTSLAVKLAHHFNGEIISADSRQVYTGMDIGTGKDLAEYIYQGKKIAYHLIDVVSPKKFFSLAQYQKLAFKAIDDVIARGHLPILVGGSGLYLEAVVDNYSLSNVKGSLVDREELEDLPLEILQSKIRKINPKFFKEIKVSDLKNKRRLARYLEILLTENDFSPKKNEPRYETLVLGLNPNREEIREKIYNRLVTRLEDEGMIDEVEKLKKDGVSWQRLEGFGLEYKWIAYFLQGQVSYQEMFNKLFTAISQFSKRQMTWFRRWEKQGREIIWLSEGKDSKKEISKFLSKNYNVQK